LRRPKLSAKGSSVRGRRMSSHDGITELYSLIVDFFHCVMYSNYKKLASAFRLAAETSYYHIIINNVL